MWAISDILLFQHWVVILLGIPVIPLTGDSCYTIDVHGLIKADKDAIEKFGESYKAYMKKVPRANFLLGIIRLFRKSDK
jgi:protein-S-isoprenylcysteine O-methyltransferase Ste14